MRKLLFLVLAATALTPASAQRQPTPDQRLDRLERQVRQVQRQVFPKGQPADTAGFSDEPAATQATVTTLTSRIESLEQQMANILRQAEENGHRLEVMEAELARLRADQDRRFRALENPGAPTDAPGTNAVEPQPPETVPVNPSGAASDGPPPPPRPKVERPRPKPAAAAIPSEMPSTGNFAADGEAAYDIGYQLWLQKKFPEAVTSLRAMASSFPGHRRVSWANNLAGRALLDSGQPRPAAETLLANYRGNPQGERAADSLFYLGQALVKLKQPSQACKAYDELADVYGATMRPDLRKLLPAARADAGCR